MPRIIMCFGSIRALKKEMKMFKITRSSATYSNLEITIYSNSVLLNKV